MHRLFNLNLLGDLPQDARELNDNQLYHLRPSLTTRLHVLEMLRRGVWRRKFVQKGIILGSREQIRPFAEVAAGPIRGTLYNHGVLGTRAEVEQLNRECIAFGEAMGPHLAQFFPCAGGWR